MVSSKLTRPASVPIQSVELCRTEALVHGRNEGFDVFGKRLRARLGRVVVGTVDLAHQHLASVAVGETLAHALGGRIADLVGSLGGALDEQELPAVGTRREAVCHLLGPGAV